MNPPPDKQSPINTESKSSIAEPAVLLILFIFAGYGLYTIFFDNKENQNPPTQTGQQNLTPAQQLAIIELNAYVETTHPTALAFDELIARLERKTGLNQNSIAEQLNAARELLKQNHIHTITMLDLLRAANNNDAVISKNVTLSEFLALYLTAAIKS